MRGHRAGPVVATAVGALVVAGSLVSGCASDSEREWEVASNPRATADEIIDAGHATGIATSEDQMVVTWEVQPEDDEGPYQGAWRLYGRGNVHVADGTFGTVREASARIDVMGVRDGFLLTDYKRRRLRFLASDGTLSSAQLPEAKRGTALAGGKLRAADVQGSRTWQVVLPNERQVVPLSGLPTTDVQGIELTIDGTVWVLLPWSKDGPFRVAYAKDGKAPWTTEIIPMPKGSSTYGESISTQGHRLFVVAGHEKGEQMAVDGIFVRTVGERRWKAVDASGIPDDLTTTPQITILPDGRMLTVAGGEGAWIQRTDGDPQAEGARPAAHGFTTLHPPGTRKGSIPDVRLVGGCLWSSEQILGNSLHYSCDGGKTWREFAR